MRPMPNIKAYIYNVDVELKTTYLQPILKGYNLQVPS